MSNIKRGEVGFTYGGEKRVYCMGVNAMCAFQQRTGEDVMATLEAFAASERVDFVKLRVLFAVGVVGGADDDEAGDMIDSIGILEAMEIVSKSVEASFPEVDEGEGKPAGKARKRSSKAA